MYVGTNLGEGGGGRPGGHEPKLELVLASQLLVGGGGHVPPQ